MKKRIISILLSLTMVAGLLSGCGGGSDSAGSSSIPQENVDDIQEAVDSAATAEDTGLTPEEQEAVDAGLIALDLFLLLKTPRLLKKNMEKFPCFSSTILIVWFP